MDPFELARQGLVAVEAGLLEDAALLFTTGLQVTPTGQTRFASKLLKDRADCHWGLGHTKEACADVKKALDLSPGMKARGMFFLTIIQVMIAKCLSNVLFRLLYSFTIV